MGFFPYRNDKGTLCKSRIAADIYFIAAIVWCFVPWLAWSWTDINMVFEATRPLDAHAILLWEFSPWLSPFLFMFAYSIRSGKWTSLMSGKGNVRLLASASIALLWSLLTMPRPFHS